MSLLACLLLALVQGLRFRDLSYCVDDSWISFRIARNLVEHGILSFDIGSPPVEGMTNLLWTLLIAGWLRVSGGGDPVHMARLMGMMAMLGAVLCAGLLAARVSRRHGGSGCLAGGVAALLVAANGNLFFYASSGLETPLWALLFLLGLERLDCALERGSQWRWCSAGLVFGLLAMTRPEGVLVGALLLGAAGLVHLRRSWLALAVFGAMVVGLELFRWRYYGALVPNTFHAKPPDVAAGLGYLGKYLLVGLGVVAPLATFPALRSSRARVLVGLLVVLLCGTAWSGGDWMPGFRRCVLPSLGLALLAGIGLAWARGWWRPVALTACLVWLGALGLAGLNGWDSSVYNHRVMVELGRRASASPTIQRVALVDIGRFGWEFEGSVFDLVGLTDAHIAQQMGGHAEKAWDDAYFRRRSPEMVLVRSETPIEDPLLVQPVIGLAERPLLLSVFTHGGWVHHSTMEIDVDKFLLVFHREDVELPAAIWGPPIPKGLRQLLVEQSLGGE